MLTSLPDPAPGTVRRTVSLEVSPDPDWSAGLRATALGRDLLVGVGGACGTPGDAVGPDGSAVLRTVRMSVTIDAASRVTGIESTLPAAVTDPLIGATAVSGFRARLAGLAGVDPSSLDLSSLESAVLDELPTVRLIAGYAQMIELLGLAEASEASGSFGSPGLPGPEGQQDRHSPMVGICVGWSAGATADTRERAGVPVMEGTPPAPALASMTPYFHAEPVPRRRTMRRRRILDVTPGGSGYEVFEYFRDSHFDQGLREGALHEYEVHARMSADERCTLEDIAVTPHALPFPECPLAAPNAADLAGARLGEIAGTVKERLTGTRSCTHLNDTLRFLRYVPALAVSCPGLDASAGSAPGSRTATHGTGDR